MPVSSKHSGWRLDPSNDRLDIYYNGTRVGHVSATQLAVALAAAVTGDLSVTGEITVSGTGTNSIDGTALLMPNLPTSDPSVAGQIWASTGTLTVSAG